MAASIVSASASSSFPETGQINRDDLIYRAYGYGACERDGKLCILKVSENFRTKMFSYSLSEDSTNLLYLLKGESEEDLRGIERLMKSSGFTDLADQLFEHLHKTNEKGVPNLFLIDSEIKVKGLITLMKKWPAYDCSSFFKREEALLSQAPNLYWYGALLSFFKENAVTLEPFSDLVEMVCKRDPSNLWKSIPLSPEARELFRTLPEGQKKKLKEVNFYERNVHLYEVSEKVPDLKTSSINFLWINREKVDEDQPYIFMETTDSSKRFESFQERLVEPLKEWIEKNPGMDVNLWYDGGLVPEAVLNRTFDAITASIPEELRTNLHMRSIRALPSVIKHPRFFEEGVPVYYRVDLVKLLVLHHTAVVEEGKRYAFVSDLDVTPMSSEQLFQKKTMEGFKKVGLLCGFNKFQCVENSFTAIDGENTNAVSLVNKKLFEGDESFFSSRTSLEVLKPNPFDPERRYASEYIYNRVYMRMYYENISKVDKSVWEDYLYVKYFESPESRFAK